MVFISFLIIFFFVSTGEDPDDFQSFETVLVLISQSSDWDAVGICILLIIINHDVSVTFGRFLRDLHIFPLIIINLSSLGH